MLATRALVAGKKHLAKGTPQGKVAAAKLVNYAKAQVAPQHFPVAKAQSERVYALMLKPG